MRHEISQQLHFNYRAYQNKIREIDRVTVEAHNEKYPENHPYHFCEKMEPCPFEGNLANAKVILLLGNPHYQPTQSSPKDHVPIDDWGVWGFSENTASSMHGWWRPRLRSFVNDYESEEEWKVLSQKVASFQTIAWASQRFYDCSQLPSKGLMAQVLRDLIHNRSDVIFVVMRNKKYWEKMFAGTTGKVIYTKNPRCSYLTKNNLTDLSDWHLLIDTLLTEKI